MKKFIAVVITLVMAVSLMFTAIAVFASEAAPAEAASEAVSEDATLSEEPAEAPLNDLSDLFIAPTEIYAPADDTLSEDITVEEPADEDLTETVITEDPAAEGSEEAAEEDTEEAADEETAEEESAEAEEAEAEETEEETEEEAEAEETEEETEEEAEAEEVEDAVLELSAFADGGVYVITIDAGGTTYAVANNGGAITASAIASVDNATDAMKWIAAGTSKASLVNNGTYLYYDKSGLILTSTSSAKSNWVMSGTTFFYQAGGDKYYVSGVSGGSVTLTKDSGAAAACVLKGVNGTEDPDTSDSGSDSEGGGGSGSSSTYTRIDPKKDGFTTKYIELVDASGNALKLDMGSFSTSSVTVTDNTATVSKSTSIEVVAVGGGYTLRMQDPPDTWNYIFVKDGVLTADDKDNPGEATSFNNWHLDRDGLLYYDDNGTEYYLTPSGVVTKADRSITLYGGDTVSSGGGGGGGGGGSSSEIVATDANGPAITKQPEATSFMTEGSGYAAPVYSVTAALPSDSTATAITFTWYVNGNVDRTWNTSAAQGEEVTSTVTLTSLQGKTFGVYPVYCVVSCDVTSEETTTTYSNTSITVNFIVCKGINNNEFLTFSDVHETFSNIGNALNNMMTNDKGLIPALIICTGDWANSRYMGGDASSENYKTTTEVYLSRLIGQSGGIDTVFVAGNHDNSQAAKDASIQAGLGASEDTNVVFDSKVAQESGNSSKDMEGLIVYGINYEDIADGSGYSYNNILSDLRSFLEDLREDYAGQLIVISAHAGLHNVNGSWAGGDSYNIDQADKVVDLLNEYAQTGMNIMFFFGHDHSKGESELMVRPGQTISAVVEHNALSVEKTIYFTYCHAGYITKSIGGQQRYTVVEYSDLDKPEASIEHTMYQLNSEAKATKQDSLSGEERAVTDYQFLEGENGYWKAGDKEGLTVRVNGDINVFIGVAVDGNDVSPEYYTAVHGSTIVTLKPEYLATLTSGLHDLVIKFSNGDAATKFTVENFDPEIAPADEPASGGQNGNGGPDGNGGHKSVPRTGDDNNMLIWLLLFAAAITAIATTATVVIKRK